MTNDQCIQVAEKIWGWKRTERNEGHLKYPMWYTHPNDLVSLNYLVWEVNSWEGFGITVEAMESRDYEIMHHSTGREGVYIHFCRWQLPDDEELEKCGRGVGDFITATHLAALEALKK